jgi:L-ascorbate metabolism protein UlaG (beta-lactamase superfamily)
MSARNWPIIFIVFMLLLSGCGKAGTPPTLTPVVLAETPLPTSSPTLSPTLPPPIPEITSTPQPTATTNPIALSFSEIQDQVILQQESFIALDLNNFLHMRNTTAEGMTWSAAGSEHIAASISDGVLIAHPLDPAWYGSENVQVEACEPTGTCATQEIIYSVLDEVNYSGVRVTYVGNSGFLITVGEKKVLIDAFFEGFPPGYMLPEYVQTPLLNAEPPFDDVDLILATHNHADHFSAAMVRQHMQNNPNAIFISTTQAASQLEDFGDRVIAADPTRVETVTVDANGIQVEAIYLSHGVPTNGAEEVFNNAYIVTINQIKAFHTGDISALSSVLPYNLSDMDIDFAFIPHFYLQNSASRAILNAEIGADYLFPIHYEYTEPAFNIAVVKFNYPEAIVFYSELDSWIMPLPEN